MFFFIFTLFFPAIILFFNNLTSETSCIAFTYFSSHYYFLHFCIFQFLYDVLWERTSVSRARAINPILFYFDPSLSLPLLPSLGRSIVRREREDKYVSTGVRAEEAHFQWKSDSQVETRERDAVIKVFRSLNYCSSRVTVSVELPR